MLEVLLEQLATAEERKEYRSLNGATLLHVAAEENDVYRLNQFVYADGFNPNVLNDEKETALVVATRSDSFSAAEFLISCGCNVNELTRLSDSALLWAAYKGDIAMINLLLQNGADVYHKYRDGRDMFLWALHMGRYEAIKYILENIAINLNVKDESGRGWRENCSSSDVIFLVEKHITESKITLLLWIKSSRFIISDLFEYMTIKEINSFYTSM